MYMYIKGERERERTRESTARFDQLRYVENILDDTTFQRENTGESNLAKAWQEHEAQKHGKHRASTTPDVSSLRAQFPILPLVFILFVAKRLA